MDSLNNINTETIGRLLLEYVANILRKAGFKESEDFSINHILAGVIVQDGLYIISVPTPYFEEHKDEEKMKRMLKVVKEKIGDAEIIVDYTLADFTFKYKLDNNNLVSSIDITDYRMVFAELRIYLDEKKVREILGYMTKNNL